MVWLGSKKGLQIVVPFFFSVYVDAPVSVLNRAVEPHRVDNDPEGVFSFYKVGPFSVMESKRNDGRVFFSVMRD